MKHKTYMLTTPLSAEETVARVETLFAKAGVQYKTEGLSVISTRTPIPLSSFDRTRYSNRNWIGLNPFTSTSGVTVRCRSKKMGPTEVFVEVNRARTFLWVAFWLCVSGLASAGMPTLQGAILLVLVSSVTAWLGLVFLLAGYLLKKEITSCLNAKVTLPITSVT
jgi:hypothetical protein